MQGTDHVVSMQTNVAMKLQTLGFLYINHHLKNQLRNVKYFLYTYPDLMKITMEKVFFYAHQVYFNLCRLCQKTNNVIIHTYRCYMASSYYFLIVHYASGIYVDHVFLYIMQFIIFYSLYCSIACSFKNARSLLSSTIGMSMWCKFTV